jgi:hypothetical protein
LKGANTLSAVAAEFTDSKGTIGMDELKEMRDGLMKSLTFPNIGKKPINDSDKKWLVNKAMIDGGGKFSSFFAGFDFTYAGDDSMFSSASDAKITEMLQLTLNDIVREVSASRGRATVNGESVELMGSPLDPPPR